LNHLGFPSRANFDSSADCLEVSMDGEGLFE
jgi:hypothetical protein